MDNSLNKFTFLLSKNIRKRDECNIHHKTKKNINVFMYCPYCIDDNLKVLTNTGFLNDSGCLYIYKEFELDKSMLVPFTLSNLKTGRDLYKNVER